jgi:hypothetical protein
MLNKRPAVLGISKNSNLKEPATETKAEFTY